MRLSIYVTTAILSLFLNCTFVFAKKTPLARNQHVLLSQRNNWYYTPTGRWDKTEQTPRSLYHLNYGPLGGAPEQIARTYLIQNNSLFKMQPNLSDLQTTVVQESPGGHHVRFQQTFQGIPLYRSDVVISINKKNVVTFVMNNYKPGISLPSISPSFSREEAIRIAHDYCKIKEPPLREEQCTLIIFAEDNNLRLAYQVIIASPDPRGLWETFINAHSGEVIQNQDIAVYDNPRPINTRSKNAMMLTIGSGYIYNPDPLTKAGVFYGSPGFIDSSDADSPELTLQRVLMPLKDIIFDGSRYQLSGPYVTIEDWDNPRIAPVTATDPDSFRFTRSHPGFEAVNIYFHIDSSQRYIQSLGFSNIQNLSISADPQGFNGDDNAAYYPNLNALTFGEGGVDDAEDADIILHEYGHAIQFGTVPGWGGGEEGAIGEGFGDYWAGSYSRAYNPTFSRNFFATWDAGFNGTSGKVWGGRPLNDSRIYPDTGIANAEVHNAGQIWSSMVMTLWDDLGKDVMDPLILLSHFFMGTSGTMRDNAAAIIQADFQLFDAIHYTQLVTRFAQKNFIAGPQIVHQPLRDREDTTGSYTISMRVSPGYFPIDTTNVKVFWGRNASFSDSLSLSPTGIENEFSGQIPSDGVSSTYRYYIMVKDTFGLTVTDPKNAPASFHSFYAGRDTIFPRVSFTPLHDHSIVSWPPRVLLTATDNISIRSAEVEYIRQRGSLSGSFPLYAISDSTFQEYFLLDTSLIMVGDTILYRVLVSDSASIPNVVTIPLSGYFRFMVSQGNILLVNNDVDTPPTVSSPQLFYNALSNKGFSVDTVNFGNLPSALLQIYDLVILSAGINPFPFTVPTKRQAIVSRVDNGGKVLVEGGHVGWLYRKSGPFDAEPHFRRKVLHDSNWVSDVTTSDIAFAQPSHRIFTTPHSLTGPIPLTTRTATADRDAMRLNPADIGAERVGGWAGITNAASIIVYTQPATSKPLTIFYTFAIASITDTTIAKKLIENTLSAFFPSVNLTDVEQEKESLPINFSLDQNFPNPFNPITTIKYQLPVRSRVKMIIFNVLGQEMKTLVDEIQNAGFMSVEWNSTNRVGSSITSGVYFYRLEAVSVTDPTRSFVQVRKLLLLK